MSAQPISVVHRIHLGHVTLPDSHPRAADGTCPILCFAIEHPDGLILVDTGPRMGHEVIDQLYAPEVMSIVSGLHAVGLDERDVAALVNTHLHFDHCGQNHLLPHAPVWVTGAEVDAAAVEFYTVPEWAHIEPKRIRLSSDGEALAAGIRLLHTPGHTPGHQSVAVETGAGLEVIVGQTCYSCAEFAGDGPEPADMHDPGWLEVGEESLRRLRQLSPAVAHFSHDTNTYNVGSSHTPVG